MSLSNLSVLLPPVLMMVRIWQSEMKPSTRNTTPAAQHTACGTARAPATQLFTVHAIPPLHATATALWQQGDPLPLLLLQLLDTAHSHAHTHSHSRLNLQLESVAARVRVGSRDESHRKVNMLISRRCSHNRSRNRNHNSLNFADEIRRAPTDEAGGAAAEASIANQRDARGAQRA